MSPVIMPKKAWRQKLASQVTKESYEQTKTITVKAWL